jgi:2,3-bisphosphoglycerate-independent phosphoglycerate mutase
MKYIVLVPDGMAGEPLEEIDNRTCMEAARTPNMDSVAREGIVGLVRNVPRGMVPASDVANLSILGYDPKKYYCGRGPLEAANLGVDLGPEDVAFRFNTVTVSDGRMFDYSAGHISTQESRILVDELNGKLADERFRFYAGTSYRNLMVMKCSSGEEAERFAKIKCSPPHDILDRKIARYLPADDDLRRIMRTSREILAGHDVNKVRIDLGQNPANMIWIWGQGMKPDMPVFMEAYKLSGGIISAVDLIKGLGRILGLKVVEVEGATGYYDTNYEGKAAAAIEILRENDFVFVHVEAPDEAGHNGEVMAKIKAIENFDSKITGAVLKEFQGRDDVRIMILPDHPTPITRRTHTHEAVPVAISGNGIEPDDVTVFSERSASAGSLKVKKGSDLMKYMLTA